jgi:hypothetical protein
MEFADIGAVELRGLPGEVPVCEVLWEPDPAVPSDLL